MPSTCGCTPTCGVTLQTTNVPGIEGPAGVDGAAGEDGIDAFSFTTANFIVPAIGSDVTIPVTSSAWMGIGQVLFIEGQGHFAVVSKPTATSVTATFLGYQGDSTPGATIATGAQVSPGAVANTKHAVTEVDNDYSALATDEIIIVTVDGKTVTLPAASGVNGQFYTVKDTAVYVSGVTVEGDGAETIDSAANVVIAVQNGFVTAVSDGTEWHVISSKLT